MSGGGRGRAGVTPLAADAARDALALENEHVHQIYEEIAEHFSDTRYKPWPVVHAFLERLPTGSIVADVGCGNGKYMCGRRDLAFIGLDRSFGLTRICRARGLEAHVADALRTPLRTASFDAAISVAVLHHAATAARRLAGIKVRRLLTSAAV